MNQSLCSVTRQNPWWQFRLTESAVLMARNDGKKDTKVLGSRKCCVGGNSDKSQ